MACKELTSSEKEDQTTDNDRPEEVRWRTKCIIGLEMAINSTRWVLCQWWADGGDAVPSIRFTHFRTDFTCLHLLTDDASSTVM